MYSATTLEGSGLVRRVELDHVHANKGGHRDAFSNEWRKALCILRGPLSRPLSIE